MIELMLTNPGGRLDVAQIIGRNNEIARYWKILANRSLVLTAERRIGKTHILAKMEADGCNGFLPFYQELESVHSTVELIRSIYTTVRPAVGLAAKTKGVMVQAWTALVPKRIKDIDVPTAKENWKALLRAALTDVAENLEEGHLAVFLWDEFPLMLYNLVRREGEATAVELLDTLRHIRQLHYQKLRFVLTGSIGLHLVLRSLRRAGNANDPTNDMTTETVPAMCAVDAQELAARLLGGIGCPAEPLTSIAAAVANQVDGFPYYIHHLVDRLDRTPRAFTRASVRGAAREMILADNDPAHFGYYVERIKTYYDAGEQQTALAILDTLCRVKKGLNLGDLANRVRHIHADTDDESIRNCLRLLREDHYLTIAKTGAHTAYSFRWNMVKEWWKENRS